ncbi:MAG TPA: hypothetical protein VMJ11_29400 [Paraburkholderia sp.]|uniref:hypothetical protein n=1 Tax=Paraburkholderia sp. TaxID=1926495 RepID=UPI002BBBA495|nr:hypothetical protein [Paraburkholderia sp.]HTR10698.1 hypothetical protein [Paraburkholderia sp.]
MTTLDIAARIHARFASRVVHTTGAALRRLVCSAGIGAAVFASHSAIAAPEGTIYFAGVAYTSNDSDIARSYPHLSIELTGNGAVALNSRIRSLIQGQTLPESIAFDSLGSINDASKATALALALDGETTSVEHIGNVYKLRTEISGEALFFDFKEKQVLGGFPFTIDYIDVSSTPPGDADIRKAFHEMIVGAPNRHDVASEFVKVLERSQVPNAANKHLRVTVSTLGPKAVEYIQQVAPQLDQAAFTQEVAREFGEYLGANQQLSILPYGSNQAIGKSMAARFIEGDAVSLKIPDADYEIHLNVAGFKKFEQSRSNVDALLLYGAFVDVDVLEPLSQKVYFSQRIKQGESKTIPLTQASVDDWSLSTDTLLSLFDNFTKAMSNSRSAWLNSGLPDNRQARDQFSSLEELVKSCR